MAYIDAGHDGRSGVLGGADMPSGVDVGICESGNGVFDGRCDPGAFRSFAAMLGSMGLLKGLRLPPSVLRPAGSADNAGDGCTVCVSGLDGVENPAGVGVPVSSLLALCVVVPDVAKCGLNGVVKPRMGVEKPGRAGFVDTCSGSFASSFKRSGSFWFLSSSPSRVSSISHCLRFLSAEARAAAEGSISPLLEAKLNPEKVVSPTDMSSDTDSTVTSSSHFASSCCALATEAAEGTSDASRPDAKAKVGKEAPADVNRGISVSSG